MKINSSPIKSELQQRLRRIEGQARGVQKMLDDDRDCHEILQQLNAIQAAVENATALFMRAYAKDCLMGADGVDALQREAMVDDLLDLIAKVR